VILKAMTEPTAICKKKDASVFQKTSREHDAEPQTANITYK
jgi:hypothetical protein